MDSSPVSESEKPPDDTGGKGVGDDAKNIPGHTQIEWYEHEAATVSEIVEVKQRTGLTYKQLLQLAAVTVNRADEQELKSLIGEVQMQS